MISIESSDSTYQGCLDLAFNPTGSLSNRACQRILSQSDDRRWRPRESTMFTNLGRSDFSGVDVQLNWTRQLENGGGLNLNTSITHNLHEKTQDRPELPEFERAGYNSCSLYLQCLNYDYRVFTPGC